MRKVETWQIQQLHAILAAIGRVKDKEFKAGLVEQYSNGRATSTKDLHYDEAQRLIADLNNANKPQQPVPVKKLNAVFSIAHQLKWYTPETINTEKPKLDYERIDNFCIKSGHWHKKLNDHETNELSIVIFQFGEVLKSGLKGI